MTRGTRSERPSDAGRERSVRQNVGGSARLRVRLGRVDGVYGGAAQTFAVSEPFTTAAASIALAVSAIAQVFAVLLFGYVAWARVRPPSRPTSGVK